MDYNFNKVERKWREKWAKNKTYKTSNISSQTKCYVLDMFPYPSGAGLHVGHPLGYIASDIYARFKKLKGFNVLHPMGYDAFGLPAEQYAIQTGQHPKITTDDNLIRYREQLEKIGFSFDWDREIRTCDPNYYKWTQWIFAQLFKSWFNNQSQKAEKIDTLILIFENEGNETVDAACKETPLFTREEWNAKSEKEQSDILLNYRLAYLSESMVNWCPALGTVLANDEVINGLSERGGHPVERKLMLQWSLRISAYAERLLQGLEEIDWTDSLKEMQRNWIGKSTGASVNFKVARSEKSIEVFTTRPDTIFGVSFMVIAPEHEYVEQLTTAEKKSAVEEYVTAAKNKSERERMADVKNVTGVFTGAYVVHPFTGKEIPIWIGDYVLEGYGTGAVMAVAAHDSRDYAFAKEFHLPILPVIEGGNIEEEAYEAKSGKLINSDFLDGLKVKQAIKTAIWKIETQALGEGKTNYRLRDAIFGRQRYWGEPIPMIFKNGIPKLLDESKYPLTLPEIDEYLPTEDGDPPLGRAKNWKPENGDHYELSTMPGWAGSSWYYLRYMDPQNDGTFASREATDYWNQVDLYIGGTEHATGHLLYSRFWCKVLHDLDYIGFDEPFKKLINQGMILGTSAIAHRVNDTNTFVSKGLKDKYKTTPIHVDVNIVKNDELDIEAFKTWRPEFVDAKFELENGKFLCDEEVEKMSKRWFNVVNPDDIVLEHGADVLRLYEMFLGPLEQAKPWSTKGIDGVSRFIRKLWNLYHDADGNFSVSEGKGSKEELKALHTLIKKVQDDIENFSFNTSVSAFMVCVNELQRLNCNKTEVLRELAIIISPYAPFITEELWDKLGETESITKASYPEFNASYLIENSHTYPISFNGKMRFKLEFPIDMDKTEIEKQVLEHKDAQKWLDGKTPKKVIVVPKKIVNIVL
ncbi:MAG: leucine--tRNA ligase [Flavobacteriales bacterium]|nr:leucine--tRNA ligase [Flavobacteriales bacterium]